MARRCRKPRKSRSRDEGEEGSTLLFEISCRRDPELLMQIAEDAMRLLEDPNADEDTKAFARGMLCMSSAFIKIWRFLWPPAVQVEFVFDQHQYADILAENVGKFVKVEKTTRVVDGKEYPSLRIDWESWHSIKTLTGAPIDPPDLLAMNYLGQKNKDKALERLMQDLLLFSLTTEVDLRFADKTEEE